MNNISGYFDPHVDEENIKAVRKRYGPDIVSLTGPALGDAKIDEVTKGDEEGQRVLRKMDAARVLAPDVEATGLGVESAVGYFAVVERGKLGLRKADESGVPEEADLLAASLAAKAAMI